MSYSLSELRLPGVPKNRKPKGLNKNVPQQSTIVTENVESSLKKLLLKEEVLEIIDDNSENDNSENKN